MIFIIDWALDDSEIRKREKFAISKKKSAGGLLHDLEGKPDVDWLAVKRLCHAEVCFFPGEEDVCLSKKGNFAFG